MNFTPTFQSTPLKGGVNTDEYKDGRVSNIAKASEFPFIYSSFGREYLNFNKPNNVEEHMMKATSMSQNGLNEQNTIYQQRKELQLMIQELKTRDKELNDMVHSHHKQLVSWEMDKKHMRFLEKELSKSKVDLKKKQEQLKRLKERLKLCENGVQSKSHELETTQIHLQQLTFKANQSSNQLLEIEMKNKSLKNSVEELSSTVANLQGRDQKTATLLRLKEKDLCDANKKVDELLEKFETSKEICQGLKDKENGYKNEIDALRNENSALKIEVENFKKSVSQLHTSLSQEDVSQLKQENLFLQKELFHAGEREKRKECLIELSKSRQERTEAELGHMRQLYDNVQREILLLKHKIAAHDDSFSIASDLESSFSFSGVEKMSNASSSEKRERESFLLEKVNLHTKSYEQEDISRMSASELMNHCKWKLESANGELCCSPLPETSPTMQRLKNKNVVIYSTSGDAMDPAMQSEFELKNHTMEESYVLVPKAYMNRIKNEVNILKDTLPKILNKLVLKSSAEFLDREKEKLQFSKEKRLLEEELELLKKRYDSVLSEAEQERQENADLRKQVFELKEITDEQSAYCAMLGGTTCSLLWRISQNEDSIHMLLSGDNADGFFQLACHTLESYVNAVHSSPTRLDSANNEYRFVLALMGVITNITASAFGRELLSSHVSGKEVLKIMLNIVSEFPFQEMKWMKMRNMALKCMYNISINQKGMKFLCSLKSLLSDLSQVIQDDKLPDNKLHALRLLQSMVCEPGCIEVLHSVLELFPVSKLKVLSQNAKGEVLNAFQDLIADLLLLTKEL